jgi:hypothetical protein
MEGAGRPLNPPRKKLIVLTDLNACLFSAGNNDSKTDIDCTFAKLRKEQFFSYTTYFYPFGRRCEVPEGVYFQGSPWSLVRDFQAAAGLIPTLCQERAVVTEFIEVSPFQNINFF